MNRGVVYWENPRTGVPISNMVINEWTLSVRRYPYVRAGNASTSNLIPLICKMIIVLLLQEHLYSEQTVLSIEVSSI